MPLLRRLKHIAIIKNYNLYTSEASVWNDIGILAHQLKIGGSQLLTVHVITRAEEGTPIAHPDLSKPAFFGTYSAQQRTSFLSDPPPSLTSLPLARRGEGYQLEFSNQSPISLPLAHGVKRTRRHMLAPKIARVGSYTYTLNLASRHARSPPHIPTQFPMSAYLEMMLAILGDEERDEVVSWAARVLEWREKAGAELKDW
jgi:hypothetical protein